MRQRLLAGGIALALALAGGGFAYATLTGGGSPSPSPTPQPTLPSTVPPSPTAAVACGAKVPASADAAPQRANEFTRPPPLTIQKQATYVATMETSCGTIKIELDAAEAPNTVNSIVFLAQRHFYDGVTFHRIARDFVIQGGDPTGTGNGGPGYTTVDKPPASAQYPVGAVAMAKTQTDPAGTAGSQFFIVTSASAQSALAPGGVGQYAIVGHVVSGLKVVKKIGALPIKNNASDGPPTKSVYIEKFSVTKTT